MTGETRVTFTCGRTASEVSLPVSASLPCRPILDGDLATGGTGLLDTGRDECERNLRGSEGRSGSCGEAVISPCRFLGMIGGEKVGARACVW
jgi:hypothetical protein